MLANISMKFDEDTLKAFQVTERKWFCDRQTTSVKTICLPTLKGGDLISQYINSMNQELMTSDQLLVCTQALT